MTMVSSEPFRQGGRIIFITYYYTNITHTTLLHHLLPPCSMILNPPLTLVLPDEILKSLASTTKTVTSEYSNTYVIFLSRMIMRLFSFMTADFSVRCASPCSLFRLSSYHTSARFCLTIINCKK